jgi:hypothetical protein
MYPFPKLVNELLEGEVHAYNVTAEYARGHVRYVDVRCSPKRVITLFGSPYGTVELRGAVTTTDDDWHTHVLSQRLEDVHAELTKLIHDLG